MTALDSQHLPSQGLLSHLATLANEGMPESDRPLKLPSRCVQAVLLKPQGCTGMALATLFVTLPYVAREVIPVLEAQVQSPPCEAAASSLIHTTCLHAHAHAHAQDHSHASLSAASMPLKPTAPLA